MYIVIIDHRPVNMYLHEGCLKYRKQDKIWQKIEDQYACNIHLNIKSLLGKILDWNITGCSPDFLCLLTHINGDFIWPPDTVRWEKNPPKQATCR